MEKLDAARGGDDPCDALGKSAGRSRSRITGIWWRALPARARISSAPVEPQKSPAQRRSIGRSVPASVQHLFVF
jgi:hypothetical protein